MKRISLVAAMLRQAFRGECYHRGILGLLQIEQWNISLYP